MVSKRHMLGSILSCLVGGILCAPFWFTPPAASDKNAAVEPSGTDMQVMCVVAEAMEPTTRPASWLPHRPAKKVVVLLGEGGFLPDAKDAETSPMLHSLFERARSPVKLDDPFRLGRIEITRRALREQDAASSGPRERTAFVMMWLPGYSRIGARRWCMPGSATAGRIHSRAGGCITTCDSSTDDGE